MRITAISLVLIILIGFSVTATAQKDITYPLINNSSISLSHILSIQNDIVDNYNKNFERYPPQNKQLYSLFVLNQSFNSTIILTYYGSIGLAFRENNIPTTRIIYLNQTQYGNFIGFAFARIFYYDNDIGYMTNKYRYVYVTNIYNLTQNNMRDVAHDFYYLDYSQYILENASLNKIQDANYSRLKRLGTELIQIYQSGSEIEKEEATQQFYQRANDWGFSDPSARKILEDSESKNTRKTNQTIESKNVESIGSESNKFEWPGSVPVLM